MIRIGILGLIGYETAARLLNEHRQELEARFSKRFIRSFENLSERNFKDSESALENAVSEQMKNTEFPGIYIRNIDKGGLFSSIWQACVEISESRIFYEKGSTGCKVFLNDIYVRQEIIEIQELFDENPYEADSEGAWLLIWDEDKVRMEHVNIIGYLVNDKKRIVTDGENVRYLTPPERQEKDIRDRKKICND